VKEILLNIESKETRLAILKFNRLHDLIVERKKSRQITGNIYRGKVTNILNNIQSAFIDINEGENGFIHISDILENTKKFEEMFDMDFALGYDISSYDKTNKKEEDITKILKKDQPVLVQVVKEPIGTKGARLTSNISIAGRYLVLLPNTPHRGVSRKIEEKHLRDSLKKTIKSFEMPQDMGLICRTASASATTEMLVKEAHELLKSWEDIVKKFHSSTTPICLFEESDLIKRAVITAIDKKMDRLLVDDYKTFQRCMSLYEPYKQEHTLNIELYRDSISMFDRFGIEKEIDKSLRRKIWVNSGGYLFFDRTEAMYTIDVNSGRSIKDNISANLEEAIVRINLEAAEEIARQLRLRNIGGLIICDFIDMRIRKNQRRVLDKLKESMKEDSAKCTILGMSEFGLVEMTRQRNKESLSQTIFNPCPYCSGNGVIKSHESISIEIERSLKKILFHDKEKNLCLTIHPELYKYIKEEDKNQIVILAKKAKTSIDFKTLDTLHLTQYMFSSKTNKEIPC
jgi:ribonuclease G